MRGRLEGKARLLHRGGYGEGGGQGNPRQGELLAKIRLLALEEGPLGIELRQLAFQCGRKLRRHAREIGRELPRRKARSGELGVEGEAPLPRRHGHYIALPAHGDGDGPLSQGIPYRWKFLRSDSPDTNREKGQAVQLAVRQREPREYARLLESLPRLRGSLGIGSYGIDNRRGPRPHSLERLGFSRSGQARALRDLFGIFQVERSPQLLERIERIPVTRGPSLLVRREIGPGRFRARSHGDLEASGVAQALQNLVHVALERDELELAHRDGAHPRPPVVSAANALISAADASSFIPSMMPWRAFTSNSFMRK